MRTGAANERDSGDCVSSYSALSASALDSLVESDVGVGLLGRLLDDLDERLAVGADALDLGDHGHGHFLGDVALGNDVDRELGLDVAVDRDVDDVRTDVLDVRRGSRSCGGRSRRRAARRWPRSI